MRLVTGKTGASPKRLQDEVRPVCGGDSAGGVLLSRLTETSTLSLAMTGMMLQSAGMATFGSPNQSSVFSAAERQRHGIVSSLLSLVRNSSNITSIALATAVVTATMASMGYSPSLGDISGGPQAFISGLRTAFLAMVALLVVGMVISFLKGGRVEEIPAPVPQIQTSGSSSD